MRITYIEPLMRGWDRMTSMLFTPFDMAKWFIIGFTAWLAGLVSWSNGWLSINYEPPELDDIAFGTLRSWQWLADNPVWLPLAGFLFLASAVLLGLLLWLSSRGKLMLLDNVVKNQAAISEPWSRLKHLGDSLFLWRLAFTAVCLGATMLLGLIFVGPAAASHGLEFLSGLSFASMIFSFFALLILGVVASYVSLFLDSFIVPIMYKFDLTATHAWRYFLPWLSRFGGWFVLYGLFVLALLCITAVAFALTCCLCGLGVIPYLGTVLLLPLHITYRVFSLEFLAQLDSGFEMLGPIEPMARTAAVAPASSDE